MKLICTVTQLIDLKKNTNLQLQLKLQYDCVVYMFISLQFYDEKERIINKSLILDSNYWDQKSAVNLSLVLNICYLECFVFSVSKV